MLDFRAVQLAEDEMSTQGWNAQHILQQLLSCHLSLKGASITLGFCLDSGTLIEQKNSLLRSEWDTLRAQEAWNSAQEKPKNAQEAQSLAASRQCYARCCTM